MESKYLLKVVNTYRVETEHDALELRENLCKNSGGNLTAFSYTVKEIKEAKEVVGEYYVCKATLEFNKEKECERLIKVVYEDD